MDKKIVLTIGRQFGSGGREIGRKLAGALNISYYDRELVSLAAKESGLCPEVFENADEKASDGLAYAFSVGLSYMGMYTHTQIFFRTRDCSNYRAMRSGCWPNANRVSL